VAALSGVIRAGSRGAPAGLIPGLVPCWTKKSLLGAPAGSRESFVAVVDSARGQLADDGGARGALTVGARSWTAAAASVVRSMTHPRASAEEASTYRGAAFGADGKAERIIRSLISGWAYGAIYRTSTERTAALDGWLWHYNHQRRHSALSRQPPIARLNERTNLLGIYS
jgi:Integrase core domain